MITNRRALPGVVGAGLGDHTRAPAHTIRVFRHRPLAGRACYWDPHSRNLPRFPYWNLIVTLGYTRILRGGAKVDTGGAREIKNERKSIKPEDLSRGAYGRLKPLLIKGDHRRSKGQQQKTANNRLSTLGAR